jgi:hypothetical protein
LSEGLLEELILVEAPGSSRIEARRNAIAEAAVALLIGSSHSCPALPSCSSSLRKEGRKEERERKPGFSLSGVEILL